MKEKIQEKLKKTPSSSGVYTMLDYEGKIVYIGKAKNLQNRLRQYFNNSQKNQKTAMLVSDIDDFDYIVTNSELEALVLENSLIKLNKPFYNILLKDDKTYPYFKINLLDDFPTIEVVRRIKKDGSKYFGPYMLGVSSRELLNIIHLAFPIRTCKNKLSGNKTRGCLKSFIGTCSSPCTGSISSSDYRKIVDEVIDFLQGDVNKVTELLEEKIKKSIVLEDFESAIKYRESLKILPKINRSQIVQINEPISVDVFTYIVNKNIGVISILNVRKGVLLGVQKRQVYNITNVDEVLSSYMSQYYESNPILVKEILVYPALDFKEELEEFLSKIKGEKVSLSYPKLGAKKQLIEFALNNAQEFLNNKTSEIIQEEEDTIGAVKHLKNTLNLRKTPTRIECFDISNLGYKDKVASMSVFINGVSRRREYRKFKIKLVNQIDDYMCMQEVISRRLSAFSTTDLSLSEKPDLIVIDGGKGHLNAVKDMIIPFGIDVISLAEKNESIFLPNIEQPLNLKLDDIGLKLLRRVRDEAHRFALSYQVNLRSKTMLSSSLEDIAGIGEKHAKLLYRHFKNINAIKNASIKELMEVDGIGKTRAKSIYEFFKQHSED